MKNIITLMVLILIVLFANLAYSLNIENTSIFKSNEKISPSDRIKDSQIFVYEDRIVIYIENANYAIYADTNSMDPVLDKGMTGIEVVPFSENDVKLGDIITYNPEWTKDLVVHRVIEIGEDKQGWYAYAKGDNSSVIDPGKIRFEQVKYILVGVIY